MTERSAEQAPVQTRPDTQDTAQDTAHDTARIPLAERLQRRISAASDERRNGGSARVLPPPPAELAQQSARPAERTGTTNGRSGHTEQTQSLTAQPRPQERAVQPVPSPAPSAAPSATPSASTATARRTPAGPARVPRRARLRLSRIDPWSVMKVSFLLSIAFGIVVWVAVFIIWSAIGAAGVFDNINSTVQEVLGTPTAEPFRVENYINTGKVMGFTTLLACADVLIITALATLGSFLYNIAATLLGGLEVTLASED
jgi:hypothetical protein